MFNELTKSDCFDIADMQINQLIKRINEQNIFLTVDNSAIEYIINKAYNVEYGARPIKRAISDYIEDMLSDAIIDGSIKSGDKIVVYFDDEQMNYKKV